MMGGISGPALGPNRPKPKIYDIVHLAILDALAF